MSIMEALTIRRPIPQGRESRLSFNLIDVEDILMLDRLIDKSGGERAQLARQSGANFNA